MLYEALSVNIELVPVDVSKQLLKLCRQPAVPSPASTRHLWFLWLLLDELLAWCRQLKNKETADS